MKIAAAFAALAAVAAARDVTYAEFAQWAMARDRSYMRTNNDEAQKRFEIFRKNAEIVDNLNAESDGAVFALNDFADLSQEEFAKTYLTAKFPERSRKLRDIFGKHRKGKRSLRADNPETLDLRKVGAVTDVKNQGDCGSCWAFSTTGNLEGAYFMAKGELLSFSEQMLVDCDHSCQTIEGSKSCNSACDGGMPVVAMQYVIDNGIVLEKDYPYTGVEASCARKNATKSYSFSSYTMIDANEDAMVDALNKYGPLSVGVDATYWSYYSSGIYSSSCSKSLNHGVLLVGYGAENSKKYWIIKNSWGTSWGEDGYMRLIRGADKCGVNDFVSTIIV